ncbi:hypothetical protein XELAEV_18030919mg [Xenopus laevis]|uniref:Uncharacterized protein n=1 Tax=Xenopus laevis TaxID=8355 RepID=A0A974CMU3_XENLA|nr:hypothetical protein XELAEV_18030919mg [Xenopus laevis]
MTKYSTCGVSICYKMIFTANQLGKKSHCFSRVSAARRMNALRSMSSNEVILHTVHFNSFSSPSSECILNRCSTHTAKLAAWMKYQ